MKSYEEIGFEAQQNHYAEHGEGAVRNKCEWSVHPTPLAKASYKAMADAIIAAYKEREK